MKERLTGAIILVALIVLLVPELLTGPIRAKPAPAASSTSASASVAPLGQTAPGKATLRTYTLTLGSAPPAQGTLATPAAPAQATSSGSESPAQEAPENAAGSNGPALQAAPKGTPPPAQKSRPPRGGTKAHSRLQAAKSPAHRLVREARSSASHGGWVVQLGSFASRENANRLARSLEGRGFRVSVSPAREGLRVLWRVRAGPVSDRTRAGRLAARLRALGHRGELLPAR